MTGRGSVIKVESGGNLTIADSNASTPHNFYPDYKDSAWHIDMWKLDDSGSETVSGGVITGGSSDYAHNDGGGVLVNAGGTLTMTGGSIVGCSAIGLGGGVRLAYDSAIGKNSTFTMTGGSIIGCAAKTVAVCLSPRGAHSPWVPALRSATATHNPGWWCGHQRPVEFKYHRPLYHERRNNPYMHRIIQRRCGQLWILYYVRRYD